MPNNDKTVSIKMLNGKFFYLTPSGAKVTAGGKVRPVCDVIRLVPPDDKRTRRLIRRELHRQGRTKELHETLSV